MGTLSRYNNRFRQSWRSIRQEFPISYKRDRIYIKSNREFLNWMDPRGHEEIVTPEETDPSTGRISPSSPIGKSLLNHEEGDTVEVKVPSGSEGIRDRQARDDPRRRRGMTRPKAGEPRPHDGCPRRRPRRGAGRRAVGRRRRADPGPRRQEPDPRPAGEPAAMGGVPSRRGEAAEEGRAPSRRPQAGGRGRRLREDDVGFPSTPRLRAAHGPLRGAFGAARLEARVLPPPRSRRALPADHR